MGNGVLVIAGSDPTGNAGVQADIETFYHFGIRPLHIITSLTVQNNKGMSGYYSVPKKIFLNTLNAVTDKNKIRFVKIGMLGNEYIVDAVTCFIKGNPHVKVVLDPLYKSSSGFSLIDFSGWKKLRKNLLPLCYLITPNIPEAEFLTGIKIISGEEIAAALKLINSWGAKNVLIKGGHLLRNPDDYLYDGKKIHCLRGTRIVKKGIHGTGCRMASAITAFLIRGDTLFIAVSKAKEYIREYIKK